MRHDNAILNLLYKGTVTIQDFCWDTMTTVPILSLIQANEIDYIRKIIMSPRYSGNNKLKMQKIDEVMNFRGFTRFAGGTNRLVYTHPEAPNAVFKVAIDSVGIKDNPAEFYNQKFLKPYCCKVFECSPCGTIASFEKVERITTFEEFYSIADDYFYILSRVILGKYVMEDIGIDYFMNVGIRKGCHPVILDFPYLFELDGNKLECCNQLDDGSICHGEIDYDAGFNKLVCKKCGRIYRARDLARPPKDGGALIKGIGGARMEIILKKNDKVIYNGVSDTEREYLSPNDPGMNQSGFGTIVADPTAAYGGGAAVLIRPKKAPAKVEEPKIKVQPIAHHGHETNELKKPIVDRIVNVSAGNVVHDNVITETVEKKEEKIDDVVKDIFGEELARKLEIYNIKQAIVYRLFHRHDDLKGILNAIQINELDNLVSSTIKHSIDEIIGKEESDDNCYYFNASKVVSADVCKAINCATIKDLVYYWFTTSISEKKSVMSESDIEKIRDAVDTLTEPDYDHEFDEEEDADEEVSNDPPMVKDYPFTKNEIEKLGADTRIDYLIELLNDEDWFKILMDMGFTATESIIVMSTIDRIDGYDYIRIPEEYNEIIANEFNAKPEMTEAISFCDDDEKERLIEALPTSVELESMPETTTETEETEEVETTTEAEEEEVEPEEDDEDAPVKLTKVFVSEVPKIGEADKVYLQPLAPGIDETIFKDLEPQFVSESLFAHYRDPNADGHMIRVTYDPAIGGYIPYDDKENNVAGYTPIEQDNGNIEKAINMTLGNSDDEEIEGVTGISSDIQSQIDRIKATEKRPSIDGLM